MDPPSNTYATGNMLVVTSHRPPDPFGEDHYKQPTTPGFIDVDQDELDELDQIDFVFARAPRERHEPGNVMTPTWFQDDQTFSLEVEAVLSTQKNGATTALCSVHGTPPPMWKEMGHEKMPESLIAKFYDPLHYPYQSDMNFRERIDVVAAADRDYAHEAAVYYQLHARRQHSAYMKRPNMVPKFYGTWTTTLLRKAQDKPTGKRNKIKSKLASMKKKREKKSVQVKQETRTLIPQGSRQIRIVLMEFIAGQSLLDLADEVDSEQFGIHLQPREEELPTGLSPLSVFAGVLDAMATLEILGIGTGEVMPSNILVTEQGDVVLTNFATAEVAAHTRIGWHLPELFILPTHPECMELNTYSNLAGWYPPEWVISAHQLLLDINDDNEDDLEDDFMIWTRKIFAKEEYTGKDELCRISDSSKWLEAVAEEEKR